MKIKRIIFTLAIFSFVSIGLSCKKDKVPVSIITADCPDTIYFSTQIKPMILMNCSTSGCHDVSSNSAGYSFTDHTDISSNASAILNAMKGNGYLLMPLGGPALNDTLIQQFSCWLNQGKLNN